MFSLKTKIKLTIAQIKYCFTKPRFIQSYRLRKFFLGSFLLFVDIAILANLKNELPAFDIRFDNSFTVENKAQAKTIVTPLEKKVDLVDFIFSKESSRGVNNYSKCESIGKFNRYGFGIPGDGSYICFEKDDDTVAVAGWITHHKALGYTDNQLLCLYNTGSAKEDCPYLH